MQVTIKTRHSIGDQLWRIAKYRDGKFRVTEYRVTGINAYARVTESGAISPETMYDLRSTNIVHDCAYDTFLGLTESEVASKFYTSKEQLIKSIMD